MRITKLLHPLYCHKQRLFFCIISYVSHTIAGAAVTVEANSTLAGELGPLSWSANSVGVAAMSSSETWVLLWLSS